MLHDGLFWPQTDKSSQVKFYSACHFYFQIFILKNAQGKKRGFVQ